MGKQLDSLADMVTFGVAPGVIVFVLLKICFLHPFCPNYPELESGQILNVFSGDLNEQCYEWCPPAETRTENEELSPLEETMANNQGSYKFTSPPRYCGPILTEPGLEKAYTLFPLIALIIPVMSMFRLAKFNLDTRQTNSFIGLPTPANTLFFAALPLIIFQYSDVHSGWQHEIVEIILNPLFLAISAILMSILLVVELPLFALKFKSFGWKGNEIRYIFLTLAVILLATLWWLAIPLIIILYILLSLIQNLRHKTAAAKTSK